MKLTIDTIAAAKTEIDDWVKQEYVDPTGDSEPIYDGVVNPGGYMKARHRIMWVLKEAYDEDDGTGGGWCLTDLLNSDDVYKSFRRVRTSRAIVLPSYGILNDFAPWNDMADIDEEPEMFMVYRSMAYINVKKLPGLHRADDGAVLKSYRDHKAIILRQIEAYDPHIVIGCRPHMPEIMRDVGIDEADLHQIGSVRYASRNGRLFIQAYHPGQTMLNHEKWTDEIVGAAREIEKVGMT